MAKRTGNSDWRRAAEAERRAAERAHAQAVKDAERQRKAAEKAQREAYLQSRLDEAARLTSKAERRVVELSEVLSRSLTGPPQRIDFAALCRPRTVLTVELGDAGRPEPKPVWEHYEPLPPGPLGRLFGAAERHALKRRSCSPRT
jgi:restriction system protein